MQPSRNSVKTIVKSTFLRFQHCSTFEFLIRKTWLKLSEIDKKMDAKMHPKNVPKTPKMGPTMVGNRPKID